VLAQARCWAPRDNKVRNLQISNTSSQDFKKHLDLLGIESGIALVMHSSLISFGRLEGGVEMAYDSLIERLGSTGTLIVPTFTFNLRPEDEFDPMSTPGRTGVLSEFVRTRPGAARGAQPIHSYAAVGAKKNIVERGDPNMSFGEGSVFQRFLEEDTHWLMLGCPFDRGCTYVHQNEALASVPYREWLDLPRTRLNENGNSESITVRYYGMRSEFDGRWDPSLVEKHVLADRRCKVVPAGFGNSMFLSTKNFHEISAELLRENESIMLA
jgi:aminoglycoside 3-N-acetyltransferase